MPLVTIPYISRVLDPSGIGQVSFIDSFTYYFLAIAEVGLTVYGVREVAKVKDKPDKLSVLVSELLLLQIFASSITLLIYGGSVYFMWQRIHDLRLLLFSLSFLIAHTFTCEWYFWGREQFGFIAFRTILIRILSVVAIFLLIKRPEHYYYYYAVIVGSSIAIIIWNCIVLFLRVKISFQGINWRRHLTYIWVTYLISLCYSIPLMLDNVTLRLVSSASFVGLYAFSVRIVRLSTSLLSDSLLVFFPRIVSLSANDAPAQLQHKLKLNIQFILLFSIPMSAGLFLLAEDVIHVLLGHKFSAAVVNLQVLALFPMAKAISLFFSNPVLVAHHKEKAFLKNLAGSSGVFITAALSLGIMFNDLGMCIAVVIAEIILAICNYHSIRKLLPSLIVFDKKVFLQALVGSIFFIPICYGLRQIFSSEILRLLVSILTCIIFYLLFLLFFVKNNFVDAVKEFLNSTLQFKIFSRR